LEGETSCFLFWGDEWIPHLYARIGPAQQLLDAIERSLEPGRKQTRGVQAGAAS
jgi:hypothetical protein